MNFDTHGPVYWTHWWLSWPGWTGIGCRASVSSFFRHLTLNSDPPPSSSSLFPTTRGWQQPSKWKEFKSRSTVAKNMMWAWVDVLFLLLTHIIVWISAVIGVGLFILFKNEAWVWFPWAHCRAILPMPRDPAAYSFQNNASSEPWLIIFWFVHGLKPHIRWDKKRLRPRKCSPSQ